MITWPSNSTLPDIVITPLKEGFYIVCPEGKHCEGPFSSLSEAEEALDSMLDILHGLLKEEAGDEYLTVIRRAISEGLEKYLTTLRTDDRSRLHSELFRKYKELSTDPAADETGA